MRRLVCAFVVPNQERSGFLVSMPIWCWSPGFLASAWLCAWCVYLITSQIIFPFKKAAKAISATSFSAKLQIFRSNPLYTGNPKTGTLAYSVDPEEMQHNAAFHQGLHCLLWLKQPSGTEIHHNLENSSCYPLKYKMGSAILIISICMGKSTRIQRVNPDIQGSRILRLFLGCLYVCVCVCNKPETCSWSICLLVLE